VTDGNPGFERRTFKLEFEDPSFSGLIVRAGSANLRFLVRMEQLMALDMGNNGGGLAEQEYAEFCTMLSSRIIEWNLLTPLGEVASWLPEDLAEEEWPLLKQLARAWVSAVSSVPPPLSQPSSDGDRLAELQIPMETLSPNQWSSSMPSE
jgi:hypothetical protein